MTTPSSSHNQVRNRPEADYTPTPPADLLARHGARVLVPTEAAVAGGFPRPRSTVYRVASLLIPDDLIRNGILAAIDRVLAAIGLQTVPPPSLAELFGQDGDVVRPLRGLAELPRPVGLRVRPDAGPSVVDSWAALQQLRSAAMRRLEPSLTLDVVNRMSLDHLLFSTSVLTGVPWEGSGDDGGGGGYRRGRPGDRIPVNLLTAAPSTQLDPNLPRRPVVALLDTGVAPHPWFDPPGSIVGLTSIQTAIYNQEFQQSKNTPTQLLVDWNDVSTNTDSLVGELEECTGHGTFIAGIYRQLAPAAELLMVRIMHADGVVYEADLTLALGMLADPQSYPTGQIIDVVSLSLGYYDSGQNLPLLTTAINNLLDLGVLIVAAAGNDSTTRPFYPAALATTPSPLYKLAVTSVGAFNPNRSKALFSNDGPWVTWWEVGVATVSTFPTNAQGSETPPNSEPDPIPITNMNQHPKGVASRDGLDPDDFSAGFAVWDGTSFAAPVAGAALANALTQTSIGLTDPNMVGRAVEAKQKANIA